MLFRSLSTLASDPELKVKREPCWVFFSKISTESKRFWAIGLIVAGLCWAFQQSIYFNKLTSVFSMPTIEVIKPTDQETIEVSGGSIFVKWDQVEGASKYIFQLQVLESGKWILPSIDHRLVTSINKVKIRVLPKNSYKFLIEAYDSHDDQIAKSDTLFFEVITKKDIIN